MIKINLKKIFFRISLLILTPVVAFARGGETPVSQGLTYIIDAITGTTGITIATLALMSVGLACLYHKLEWKAFGYTVAIMSIVFGARPIVDAVASYIKK